MGNATQNVQRNTIQQLYENAKHVLATATNVKTVHHATIVQSHKDLYRLLTSVNHHVLPTFIIERTPTYAWNINATIKDAMIVQRTRLINVRNVVVIQDILFLKTDNVWSKVSYVKKILVNWKYMKLSTKYVNSVLNRIAKYAIQQWMGLFRCASNVMINTIWWMHSAMNGVHKGSSIVSIMDNRIISNSVWISLALIRNAAIVISILWNATNASPVINCRKVNVLVNVEALT